MSTTPTKCPAAARSSRKGCRKLNAAPISRAQSASQIKSNFGLYFTFAKSAGDDEGAKINADWVNDFQHWVQEQSTHGLAPNFGDAEESVIARAQNGVLWYEAEAEGTATYMVVLSLRYTKPMNRRILHENRTQIYGALSECNFCRR